MDVDNRIKQILADTAAAKTSELFELTKLYPFFALPAILLLKYHSDSLDESQTESLKLHLAICTGDRRALFDLVGDTSGVFDGIYPPEPPAQPVTTESAIDTFFAAYGTSDSAESAMLERMIFNPTPDYSELLAREEKAGTDSSPVVVPGSLEDRIEVFLRDYSDKPESDQHLTHEFSSADGESLDRKVSIPHKSRPAANESQAVADDSLLSESLAKIFIKQGRYERAYEIISTLSLNYPKKSIYFADQLRFLQKLIKIKQAATRRKDIQNSNKD